MYIYMDIYIYIYILSLPMGPRAPPPPKSHEQFNQQLKKPPTMKRPYQ